MATKTNMTIEELAKQIAEIAYSQGTDVYDAGKWLAKVLLRKNILIPTIMLRRASEQAETRLEFLEDVTMQESNRRKRTEGVGAQPSRLVKEAIMLRQASNQLGRFRIANTPVSFAKGTLFEHIRLVDGTHSWVKISGNLYLAKNADVLPKLAKPSYSTKLYEQAEAPPRQMADFQAPPQKPVSLDQVVDRYIVRYERESIPLEGEPGPGPADGAQTAGGSPGTLEEGANLKSLMSFLLMEQAPPAPPPEEEEDAPPPADAPAPDAGAGLGDFGGGGAAPEGDAGLGDDAGGGMDDAAGGGAPPPGAPPVVNTPQINLNDFARSVARMVNNFDALLNPKTIILNRVEAYIKSNYNDMTAKQFMQIMERNYGLNVTSVEYPEEDSDFPTPYAGSAVMGAGGGGS